MSFFAMEKLKMKNFCKLTRSVLIFKDFELFYSPGWTKGHYYCLIQGVGTSEVGRWWSKHNLSEDEGIAWAWEQIRSKLKGEWDLAVKKAHKEIGQSDNGVASFPELPKVQRIRELNNEYWTPQRLLEAVTAGDTDNKLALLRKIGLLDEQNHLTARSKSWGADVSRTPQLECEDTVDITEDSYKRRSRKARKHLYRRKI